MLDEKSVQIFPLRRFILFRLKKKQLKKKDPRAGGTPPRPPGGGTNLEKKPDRRAGGQIHSNFCECREAGHPPPLMWKDGGWE